MVHLDVQKFGRIPDGGGWRVHGKNSPEARAAARAKTPGARAGYAYLHSAMDGHTRQVYTESLENEQAATAVAFLKRARDWFAKHGILEIERIITDNGACYRSTAFTAALNGAEHRRTRPYTPKHNGKDEPYNRIVAEEFLYARAWTSEHQREKALETCPGTCTTTTIDPTARTTAGRPHPRPRNTSTTSWPHTTSAQSLTRVRQPAIDMAATQVAAARLPSATACS